MDVFLSLSHAAAAAATSLKTCPTVRPHRRQPTRLPRPWDSSRQEHWSEHFLLQCMKVESESEVAQSCLNSSQPHGLQLTGSSVHGIFQSRVLEWGAIAFSTLSHDLIINILGNEKLKLPALPWKFSYKYFLIIGTRYL